MKRKTFEVIVNGDVVATKFAFNTARAYINAAISDIVQPGETWERIEETQTFDGVNRIGTVQVWRNLTTGAEIVASVSLK